MHILGRMSVRRNFCLYCEVGQDIKFHIEKVLFMSIIHRYYVYQQSIVSREGISHSNSILSVIASINLVFGQKRQNGEGLRLVH